MQKDSTSRKKCILILVVLELLIGLAIILTTQLYQFVLEKYLYDIERKMLRVEFSNATILGVQMLLAYGCGACLWRGASGFEASGAYCMWNFFCLVIVGSGFGTLWALFESAQSLEESAEFSLLRGIDVYYTDPEWRLLWDDLQYHKQCCGVKSYRDWQGANWVASAYQNEDGSPCASNLISLAPYSCCKRSDSICLESYDPNSDAIGLPALNTTGINTNGCLPLFATNISQILYLILGALVTAFVLQIAIAFLTRILIVEEACCKPPDDQSPLVIVKCPRNVRCVVSPMEEAEMEEECDCLECQGEWDEEEVAMSPRERFREKRRVTFHSGASYARSGFVH